MREKIAEPKTSHLGIIEHFARVATFYNLGMSIPDVEMKFRLLLAAIYSCRAIVELMLQQAKQEELTVDYKELDSLLVEKLPYYHLIERIRIHDFHRYGLMPPIPGATVIKMHGPTTLTARNGEASLMQGVEGPTIECTGNSTVKERRPLYAVNGTFYDEDTGVQVPLDKIVKDYIFAIPSAVDDYERLVRSPQTQFSNFKFPNDAAES